LLKIGFNFKLLKDLVMSNLTISTKVVKLSKIGKSPDILVAIDKERASRRDNSGTSGDGRVTVTRVGTQKR
jgi:hypothetical protein